VPTGEINSNATWHLSPNNHEVMNFFKNFIKYNLHLVSLNLDNTGLNPQTLIVLAGLLRRCQAIRCLHMSANEGVTPAVVSWIRSRIQAKDKIETKPIASYN